jgi:hypothetical protein
MSIDDKVNDIYTDLSTNVTRIYNRQNLHLAIDLIFHSPLRFYFGKRLLEKGYPEVLIIGDTRCGKSETAKNLLRHYRLGARSSGENTTIAGLVGGVQPIRNRWRVSWGRIPLNNGRLLVIDEVCGLSTDDIGTMSDLRSSGIAEITKIQTERTNAKTRLVWLSNPRQDSSVDNVGSGPRLIKTLIGKPEDIARFDFVLILDKGEVTEDDADERQQPNVPHRYTSDLCNNLVLWAWSRSPDQVRVESATLDACFELGKAMGKKYSSDCPIVNSMEQKIKLARLSVSLACRLYSCDASGERVVVTPEHVEYIYRFLQEQYDSPHFGFDMFSRIKRASEQIENPDEVMAMLMKWGERIAYQLLYGYQITVKFFEETAGEQYDEAKMSIAKLMRNGCITKHHTFYIKTPAFLNILKSYIGKPKEDKLVKEEF